MKEGGGGACAVNEGSVALMAVGGSEGHQMRVNFKKSVFFNLLM